jgi:hypothetical protein
MIQEIITLTIVFAAVGYSIYNIAQFFKKLKNNDNLCNCGGCHSKELQDIIKKSKQKQIKPHTIRGIQKQL